MRTTETPWSIVYFGTPEIAVPPLHALLEAGYRVELVVTGAERRRGRGSTTTPSPVADAAGAAGIPITHDLADVDQLIAKPRTTPETGPPPPPRLGVVVAYGKILPSPLLERLKMVNVHFSLLPRWRGAAPVERAILEGDEETGVCVMEVEETLDTGGVHARRTVGIEPDEHVGALRGRLVEVGSALLVETLAGGPSGLADPTPQAGPTTYAAKITPDELRLTWDAPAEALSRIIRLDAAWTTFRNRRLRIADVGRTTASAPTPDVAASLVTARPGTLVGHWVATGEGALELREVIPEGRRAMTAAAWVRGMRAELGERLGA